MSAGDRQPGTLFADGVVTVQPKYGATLAASIRGDGEQWRIQVGAMAVSAPAAGSWAEVVSSANHALGPFGYQLQACVLCRSFTPRPEGAGSCEHPGGPAEVHAMDCCSRFAPGDDG